VCGVVKMVTQLGDITVVYPVAVVRGSAIWP
jgi:hypothetical protein